MSLTGAAVAGIVLAAFFVFLFLFFAIVEVLSYWHEKRYAPPDLDREYSNNVTGKNLLYGNLLAAVSARRLLDKSRQATRAMTRVRRPPLETTTDAETPTSSSGFKSKALRLSTGGRRALDRARKSPPSRLSGQKSPASASPPAVV